MKILVALKQVPDTETKVRIAADGRSIDPSDVKWITSPYDEYALEEAIRLKEGAGAEVTALCVGEDKGKDILRSPVHAVRTQKPVSVTDTAFAVDVLRLFEKYKIDDLPVVDAEGRLVGYVDIQDLPKMKVM